MLQGMIDRRRLRDISDLPFDLASCVVQNNSDRSAVSRIVR
jgi:hypothetical protein